MITVLHIINGLSRGGAARAMMSSAHETMQLGQYRHQVLSLGQVEPEAEQLAIRSNMQVFKDEAPERIAQLIESADIVQIEWWNDPEMDRFLRQALPHSRLISWMHVAGDRDPQSLSRNILEYSDVALASSPRCYRSIEAVMASEDFMRERAEMIYDCADLARVEQLQRKAHSGFCVGYIGTVNYIKMHRNFISMSAAAKIPDARFVVCGGDRQEWINKEAQVQGYGEKFEFKGYVEDIAAEVSEFDVYGYPLCEDTFASAELNLQEVMYAGVPPVVFPHGGIADLVIHDFTGLVVKSEREYSEALEFLYAEPEERERLGRNAAEYARQIFGAKNAARKFDTLYRRLMTQEKRAHHWGLDCHRPLLDQTPRGERLISNAKNQGADRFLEALGEPTVREVFLQSEAISDPEQAIEHEDREFPKFSHLMEVCGILPYTWSFPEDALLRYWGGMALFSEESYGPAATSFAQALQLGFKDWRPVWRMAQSLKRMGDKERYQACMNSLAESAPEFAQRMS